MSDFVLASSFEMSLRILLMLDTLSDTMLDEEQITAIDFIAVYAADFGLLDENLHGYGAYRYSEYPARRGLVAEAVRSLVLDRYIALNPDDDGYSFYITDLGKEVCRKLSSEYASEYRIAVDAVGESLNVHDALKMDSAIKDHALRSLKGV